MPWWLVEAATARCGHWRTPFCPHSAMFHVTLFPGRRPAGTVAPASPARVEGVLPTAPSHSVEAYSRKFTFP